MRDLQTSELGFVYGAGSSPVPPSNNCGGKAPKNKGSKNKGSKNKGSRSNGGRSRCH